MNINHHFGKYTLKISSDFPSGLGRHNTKCFKFAYMKGGRGGQHYNFFLRHSCFKDFPHHTHQASIIGKNHNFKKKTQNKSLHLLKSLVMGFTGIRPMLGSSILQGALIPKKPKASLLSHMNWQMLSSFHLYRWAKGFETWYLEKEPSILWCFHSFIILGDVPIKLPHCFKN
jgi:hypothetical protein